jgi:uncharacterized protein (TIGR03435 family)
MRRRTLVIAAVIVLCVAFVFALALPESPLRAQSASSDKPKFEVASVKPCMPSGRGAPYQWSPGRLTVYCQPARSLIVWSYIEYADGASHSELTPASKFTAELAAITSPIESEPDWVKTQDFTISAEVPGGASEAMMLGPMMQSLLEDRFNLKIHSETRELTVYNLVVAKGGPKLPQTDTSSCRAMGPNRERIGPSNAPDCVMQLNGQSMAELAELLSGPFRAGRPVIDKTRITGTFKIQLLYARDASQFPNLPPENADTPTILEAVKGQLGLELVPARGPDKILVIDHIEEPSPN